MTFAVSKLALAALVVALLPRPAAARDCEHDPAPAVAPAHRPYEPYRPHWRENSWRERELARIRADIRELEEERARFYERFGWHPRKVRRYERHYAERRAELDRRWYELQRYAWR